MRGLIVGDREMKYSVHEDNLKIAEFLSYHDSLTFAKAKAKIAMYPSTIRIENSQKSVLWVGE